MANLDDILKKYRDEEEGVEKTPGTLPISYKSTNKEGWASKFISGTKEGLLGETGVKGTTDEYVKLIKSKGYDKTQTSRKFLDAEIAFGKGFIQTVEAPIKGIFNMFMGEEGISQDSIFGKLGKGIQSAENYFGTGIDELLKDKTGEGLSDFSKKHIGGVITEGALIGGGTYALEGGLMGLKQVGKLSGKGLEVTNRLGGKFLDNIGFNKADLTSDFKKLSDEMGIYSKGVTDYSTDFSKQGEVLRQILIDLDKNGMSEKIARKKIRDLGIDPEAILKKAEDAFSPVGLENKGLSSLIFPIKSAVKGVSKFKKALADKGYDFKKVSTAGGNKEILSSFKGMQNQGKLVNYIDGERLSNLSKPQQALYKVLETNQKKFANKELGMSISPEDTLAKANGLKVMEEYGYVKKVVDTIDENNFSFKLTKRGITALKKMEVDEFIETSGKNSVIFKDDLINNGLAHIPKNKYGVVSKKVGDRLTMDEINFIVDETLAKTDIKNIKDVSFKASIGSGLSEKELSSFKNSVNSLIENKGLKLTDDELTSINAGDLDVINKVSTKIEAQIKEGFITENSIKNFGKNINLERNIGWSKKTITTTYKKFDNLPIKDIKGRMRTALKNELNKLIKKFKGKDLEIRAGIKAMKENHKNQLMAIAYQREGILGVKSELKKNLIELGNSGEYLGDVKKIIGEVTSKKYWDTLKTLDDIDNLVNRINNKIELSHIRGKMKQLENALKLPKNAKGKTLGINSISVEQLSLINVIKDVMKKAKKGEIELHQINQTLDMVNNIKLRGKSKVISDTKEYGEIISKNVDEISKDIEDIWGLANRGKTLGEKVKGLAGTYKHSLQFAPRLIRDIFKGNPKAYEIYVHNIKRAYNNFESFENKITDQMTKFVMNSFDKSPEKLQDFYDYLLVRRRIPTDEGDNFWMGFEYLKKDKGNSFNTKLDNAIPFEAKPETFKTMPDEMWDELRKTRLGQIMVDGEETTFKNATKAVDDYHELTGKMYTKTQVEIDNQFTQPENYYIAVKNLRGKEALMDLGDSFSKSGYINKGRLNLIKKNLNNMKDVELDRDFLGIIYGAEKPTRYYSFMQEDFKLAKKTYEGTSVSVKNVSMDELNKYRDMEDFSFSYMGKKIDLIEDVRNGERTVKGQIYETAQVLDKETGLLKDIEQIRLEDIPADKIRVKQMNGGLKANLNGEARNQISAYIDRIASGGVEFQSRGDHMISTITNHFNKLPLMGSISVILKQPLSIIDAMGRLGFSDFGRTLLDIKNDRKLWKSLGKHPAVANRGGGDYLLKEGKRHTVGAGWLDNVGNSYEKFTDAMLYPIQYTDQVTYGNIVLTAYRQKLVKNGIIKSQDRITSKMLDEFSISKGKDGGLVNTADLFQDAIDEADAIASTAHPLMMPKVYNKPYQKALFGIFTTQLNRIQQAVDDVPYVWKQGEKAQAVQMASMLLASNVAEVAVTVGVGKLMYQLGATTWEGYNEDFLDMMTSMSSLGRMTYGQFFLPSKFEGLLNPEWGIAPALGGLQNTAGGISDIFQSKDFDTMIENVMLTITKSVGGKLTEQTLKSYLNDFGN